MTDYLPDLVEPWMQVLILVLSAPVIFLLADAIQDRWHAFTAWLLAAAMVTGLCGPALAGILPDIQKHRQSDVPEWVIQARAALDRMDTYKAWQLAVQGMQVQQGSDDPACILLCARIALISHDLPAADHYFALLAERIESGAVAPELLAQYQQAMEQWQEVASLDRSERAEAVKNLSQAVLSQIRNENQADKDVISQLELDLDIRQLRQTLQNLISQGSADSDPEWDNLDRTLASLTSRVLTSESLDLLAMSYLARDRVSDLVLLLRQGGPEHWIKLAALYEKGQISLDNQTAGQQAWLRALLTDMLKQAKKNENLAAALIWAAVTLCATDSLDDSEQMIDVLDLARSLYPATTGHRELDRLLAQVDVMEDNQHPFWQIGQDSGSFGLGTDEMAQILPELIRPPDADRPHKPRWPTPTPEPPDLQDDWPDDWDHDDGLHEYRPMINICAPEMTQDGRIRFFTTIAAGSSGFPGGVPDMSSFEFRTNLGFRRLLSVQQFQEIENVSRYTMLVLDCRPFVPHETQLRQRSAARAFIRSMAEGEEAMIVMGGLPYEQARVFADNGTTALFGNSQMTCHRPSSDREMLEAFLDASYSGDVFATPDLFFMVNWPVSQMTAIKPDQIDGSWETTSLADVQPWLGQVIVFTNGDPDGGVSAGGSQSGDYLRGAAIRANAAIHFVGIQPVRTPEEMNELALAGRGDYIDPLSDNLMSFYQFVRERPVRVFLTECLIPENPVNAFFQLWARHVPTGVYAGFQRNPGRGMDLIGTAHYSDASMSQQDFADYTGFYEQETGAAGDTEYFDLDLDPFEDEQTGIDLDYPGSSDLFTASDLAIFPPMQHAIARGYSGMALITLPGHGLSGLQPSDIHISIPDLGRINAAFIDVSGDEMIRFFLPVNRPAGLYTLNVSIGSNHFSFPDTILLYDADGTTTLAFGPWTIQAAGMLPAEDGGGDWQLVGTSINDMVRFSDEVRLSGDWLSDSADQLILTPLGDAYIDFDPDSDSLFVQAFFLDDGSVLNLGCWQDVTLDRSGAGAAFSSRQWQDILDRPVSFGFFDFPYDTGTLYPDRVEVPVLELNVDLPMQDVILMAAGIQEFAIAGGAVITARSDDLDMQIEASIKSGTERLKCFGALTIKGLDLAVDTGESRVSVAIEADLLSGKSIQAGIAVKGLMLDALDFSIEVEVPVTVTPPSPLPVTLTELGGGVRDLADAFSGDPAALLGLTIFGSAKFESGKITQVIPFLATLPWVKPDKLPAILATDNTELSLRPWPFSLSFGTEVKLFDAFPIGRAELSLGYYAFSQTLLDISDDEAVGLHALLLVGPDIDLNVIRIGYNAGPVLDINNHGLFMRLQGGAWAGINLGPVELTADLTGTMLLAVHGIDNSSWPQLAIVLNAVPSAAIPGLWDADSPLDIRLLVNEYGVRLIGIPSPLDEALDWLNSQITSAASESWQTVTDGMNAMIDLAGDTWNLVTDTGSTLIDAGTELVSETLTEGTGLLIQTGSAAIDVVDEYTGGALSSGLQTGGQVVGDVMSGVVGWFS